jgi:hypothetical protein
MYEHVICRPQQGQAEPAGASRVDRDGAATHFAGLKTEIAHHVKQRGGAAIVVWKLLRLLTCLALVAVTIAVIVIGSEAYPPTPRPAGDGFVDATEKWGENKKQWKKHKADQGAVFTLDEWHQSSLCLVFVSFSSFHSRSLFTDGRSALCILAVVVDVIEPTETIPSSIIPSCIATSICPFRLYLQGSLAAWDFHPQTCRYC